MAEPRRLLEDAESGAERALLQAGMSYRSSRDTWTKTMTALGLAGSTAIVAGTRARAPELAMASPSAAAGAAGDETAAASKAADDEASRARGPARTPVASVTLTQELAALDAARSVLARGDAQAALFLLDGYDR